MTITDEHVREFRDLYVKASGYGVETDEELKELLNLAYHRVMKHTDEFDLDSHPDGKLLVFDCARYIRANASELFYENYFNDLNSFGFQLMIEKWREKDDSQEDAKQN